MTVPNNLKVPKEVWGSFADAKLLRRENLRATLYGARSFVEQFR